MGHWAELTNPASAGGGAMGMNPIQFQRRLSLPEFLQHYGDEAACECPLDALLTKLGCGLL